MSRLLIDRYYADLAERKQYGGQSNEGNLRKSFANLLDSYCRPRNYRLVEEIATRTARGNIIKFDGVVKNALRFDLGYWEAKDTKDDLDREIAAKFEKGYPDDNILFENTEKAVLIQSGEEAFRIELADAAALDRCLNQFLDYERPEVKGFRQAIEKFREDLPQIVEVLRETIAQEETSNQRFLELRDRFWETCKTSINPQITLFDIQEILIQHILSEDIFLNVFNDAQFHRDNNIARQVQSVVDTFFTGGLRRNVLKSIDHYYGIIRQQSAAIADHHEKQEFLKSVYENFYKAYNPKAADRLGIVYTPSEIVKFMIEGTDHLLEKHFNRYLSELGVKILDPATGTGTFITELIEYLSPPTLEQKYREDLFCNEVAILPYYIANLNIEYCYQQKTKNYEEFNNICFLDTLDHAGLKEEQKDLFSISVENTERIRRQNAEDLTVIIGNPPYNAWQENFNLRNANRPYQEIDKRLKDTYVKKGKAQNKIAVYDMYVRFYRWASDRLTEGVLCFITNSSFLDSKAFDGFRKCIQEEFDYAYFLDLGGNVREISGRDGVFIGEEHTIFGISAMTGIVIGFLVKKRGNHDGCKLFYCHPFHIHALRSEKLNYLKATKFADIDFERVRPDAKQNWINQTDNDFDQLLPLVDKEVKAGRGDRAVFHLFTSGVQSKKDEWVYDICRDNLIVRMQYMISAYEAKRQNYENSNLQDIKWDRELERHLKRGVSKAFEANLIRHALCRPFCKKYLYFDKHLNSLVYHMPYLFPLSQSQNLLIAVTNHTQVPFLVQSSNLITSLDVGGRYSQNLPIYTYDRDGNRSENITDWALQQFRKNYQDSQIQRLDIFHYTYAVLHHPAYRQKYEINLKRDFPRLPLYEDFWQWANWGRDLMDWHINYETIEPYPLDRADLPPDEKANPPKLKADKTKGTIQIDRLTTLSGIPPIAWEYKLGNRSAIEWVLDQHKEKTPKDPTIRELFNTYRFADYKERAIDLIQRVCTVSIKTMEIVQQMPAESVHQPRIS